MTNAEIFEEYRAQGIIARTGEFPTIRTDAIIRQNELTALLIDREDTGDTDATQYIDRLLQVG